MGTKSQSKGRRAEIELSKILQASGYDVRPGQAMSYGVEPDLVGLENIHIEVKRRENVNLSAALEQAQRDAAKFGGLPAVFHRANRQGWRVTMPLMAWLELYQHHKCQCGGHCSRTETDKTGKEVQSDTQQRKSTCGFIDPPDTKSGVRGGGN